MIIKEKYWNSTYIMDESGFSYIDILQRSFLNAAFYNQNVDELCQKDIYPDIGIMLLSVQHLAGL